MQNVYSVRQVNAYIKSLFDREVVLRRIYVKGEVSNCKYHTSGHIYFSLKDESGTIACVMFASARKGLAFGMKNGQQVVVLGNVNVYERDGKYQLYASEIILDGAGLLWERFEALKHRLAEMGMFAPEYKQPIPAYVRRLGVVTAPTGAAIRDIIHVSRRRNPGIQILLCPALVQGEGAAKSIARGIELLDGAGVDVIIVGRGGGSIEDLWAFNEEEVARAIFCCRTPVISAVGHETDTTIADFVADMRAPTPSAAAELAVADMRVIKARLSDCEEQLAAAIYRKIESGREGLRRREKMLRLLGPSGKLADGRMRLAGVEEKLAALMRERTEDCRFQIETRRGRMTALLEERYRNGRHAFCIYVEKLKGLSPLEKLSQGYSYTADMQGRKVVSVDQVKTGQSICVYVSDGQLQANIEQIVKHEDGTRHDGR